MSIDWNFPANTQAPICLDSRLAGIIWTHRYLHNLPQICEIVNSDWSTKFWSPGKLFWWRLTIWKINRLLTVNTFGGIWASGGLWFFLVKRNKLLISEKSRVWGQVVLDNSKAIGNWQLSTAGESINLHYEINRVQFDLRSIQMLYFKIMIFFFITDKLEQNILYF